MPETKRPIRVFLCHASQDKPAVRELYQRLKQEDWIDPWLDEEKLTLGQHWTSVIEDALDSADTVVIFLSSHSVQKEGFVQRELNYAWDISLEKPRNVIFLIPFRLDNCEVPRHLRSRQWGDYFGEEKEGTYQTLLRSLKLRYEQKLKLEEVEHAKKEKQEREIAERIAREKEERKAAEKLVQEEFAREQAKKEADEKAWLEAGEQANQKAAKEKVEYESAEKAAHERTRTDVAEKVLLEKENRGKRTPNSPRKTYPKFRPQIFLVIIGAIAVMLFAVIGSPVIVSMMSRALTPTVISTKTIVSNATNTKTPTPVLTPVGSGSGKILYVSGGDIYSINSDGTNPINLTNNDNVERIDALSPDARRIVFSSSYPKHIYIMDVDGKNIIQVTNQSLSDSFGAWLPDGRQFIFTSSDGNEGNIFLSSIDGNEQVNLTPPRAYGENFDFIALSPDGTTIWLRSLVAGAYVRRPIYAMNIDRTNILNLTSVAGVDAFGAWSPNGKQIAYYSRSSPKEDDWMHSWNYDIFVINSDGTDVANLTNGHDDSFFGAWSLDSSKVLFSSSRNGVSDVFIVSADGTDLINLTNGRGNSSGASFSPTGQKIIFSSDRDGQSDIFIMNADGSEQINLTTSPEAGDKFCAWSPDGKKILGSSSQNNRATFYTINSDGTSLTRLFDSSIYAPCPIWLP